MTLKCQERINKTLGVFTFSLLNWTLVHFAPGCDKLSQWYERSNRTETLERRRSRPSPKGTPEQFVCDGNGSRLKAADLLFKE